MTSERRAHDSLTPPITHGVASGPPYVDHSQVQGHLLHRHFEEISHQRETHDHYVAANVNEVVKAGEGLAWNRPASGALGYRNWAFA